MGFSVAVVGKVNHLNHDKGLLDVTDIDGKAVSMPNEATGGGVQVEVGGTIQQGTIGPVELLSFSVGAGYTAQGLKNPTEVYAPPQCDEFVAGGVGNVGSAGNCGETGEPVDASKARFDRLTFDLRYQPRVWIRKPEKSFAWDVSPTVGLRFEAYTGAAQALQDGSYGMVDLNNRLPLLVVGADTGVTVAQDLVGLGDLRIIGGFTYDRGNAAAEDTGGDNDPIIKGTENFDVRLGASLRW